MSHSKSTADTRHFWSKDKEKSAWNTPSLSYAFTRDSIISLLLVLFIGLGLTYWFFTWFGEEDRSELRDMLEYGAATISDHASMLSDRHVREEVTLVFKAIESASLTQPVDEALLTRFLWDDSNPYFGDAQIRYQPLKPTGLNLQQQTEETGNPESEEIVPLLAGRGQDPSFPVKINATHSELGPSSANYYSDFSFRIVMNQARDSGQVTSRHSFPQTMESDPQFITHYFYPLYNKPVRHTDIKTRRDAFTGFLSVVFTGNDSPLTALPYHTFLGLELMFVPPPVDHTSNLFSPLIQHQIDLKNIVTHSYLQENENFILAVSPSRQLEAALTTNRKWWVLTVGTLLTLGLCLLIFRNHIRAGKAIDFIHSQTSTLAQRSQDLVEANTALLESESRYRMLADNVSDMIYTHDVNGICQYVSPSSLTLTGYAPEEMVGRPVYEFFNGSEQESIRKGITTIVQRLKQEPDALVSHHPFLFQTQCKDGTFKWLETSVDVLKDNTGDIKGFLCVTRDATARIESEEEKDRLEASYRQSMKMEAIGKMAGGVAHDFNNLLTGIQGHTEILKLDKSIKPDLKRSVDVIDIATVRAKELTTQLLGFARKGNYQKEPFSVNLVVQEAASLLERAVDKRITISVKEDNTYPVVIGDTGQITQVFLNLGINARDAMTEGGLLEFTVRTVYLDDEFCNNHATLDPGTYCHISVSDTGTGIPPEKIEHIFEPFYTDKHYGKGAGMGLALVYSTIKSHNGLITINSTTGSGSIFDIYLPWYEGTKAPIAVPSPDPVLIKGSGTILVVDDEDIVLSLATIMLEKLGFDVITAINGNEAIAIYKERQSEIALVILDMVMPESDGNECLQNLRKIDPDVKVIISTGYNEESVSGLINTGQIQGFLGKPFRLEKLSKTIAQAIHG